MKIQVSVDHHLIILIYLSSALFSKAFAVAYEKHTINVTKKLSIEHKMNQNSEEVRIQRW